MSPRRALAYCSNTLNYTVARTVSLSKIIQNGGGDRPNPRDGTMGRGPHRGDTARSYIRQALKRARLFAAWPDAELSVLAESARVQVCSPGEALERRGEKAQTLRVVATGCLEASRTWADGRRVVFGLSQPFEVVDLAAIFDGEPVMFDLTARGPATVVAVPHRALRDLVEQNPSLGLSVIQALSHKARADAERLQAGLVNSPRVRLAKTLIALAADQSDRGEAPRLKITQDDLAAMLGLSRQSVVSAMKPLVREGVLEARYRSLRLVDRRRLQAVAHEEDEGAPAGARQAEV
jgi:CRP-like cAMP-binding protein